MCMRLEKLKNKRVAVILAVVVVFSCAVFVVKSSAWSNGGNTKMANPAPNVNISTLSPEAFSINVANNYSRKGQGIGTHDLLLEEAIVSVMKRPEADLSWLNVPLAQLGTAYPDTRRGEMSKYDYYHAYFGRSGNIAIYGQAPYAVSRLYSEIVAHLKRGQFNDASEKLGVLSHYIGDLAMPFHIRGAGKYFRNKRWIDYHNTHELAEIEFDYFMRQSIYKKVSNWPADLKNFARFNKTLSAMTDDSTPAEKREVWFSEGAPFKAPVNDSSARQTACSLASRVRDLYGASFVNTFGKICKRGIKAGTGGKMPYRGAATLYTFRTMPKIMKECSKALSSILYDLAVLSRHSIGYDNVFVTKVTSSVKHFKNTKLKSLVKANIYVRDFDNLRKVSGLGSIPISVKIYRGSRLLYSRRLYTNDNGTIRIGFYISRTRRDQRLTIKSSASLPMIRKEAVRNLIIRRKLK